TTVRDVARMQARAVRADKRLLTFTLETEVRFAQPSDVHAFTEELAAAVGQVVERYDSAGGRRYRMAGLGYPAPARTQGESEECRRRAADRSHYRGACGRGGGCVAGQGQDPPLARLGLRRPGRRDRPDLLHRDRGGCLRAHVATARR